jgi:hypothetical protein
VAGVALVMGVWALEERRRWMAAALAVNLVVAGGLYHLHDIARFLDIPLTRKSDPYSRVTGYRELGRQVALLLQAHPDARLLVDDRKLHALLRYYARPYSDSARYFNPEGGIANHYALTVDVADSPTGTFLLIGKALEADRVRPRFAEATPLEPIRIRLYPDYTLDFGVWRVRDYRRP